MWLLYMEAVERLVWDRQAKMEEVQKPQSNSSGEYREQKPGLKGLIDRD